MSPLNPELRLRQ